MGLQSETITGTPEVDCKVASNLYTLSLTEERLQISMSHECKASRLSDTGPLWPLQRKDCHVLCRWDAFHPTTYHSADSDHPPHSSLSPSAPESPPHPVSACVLHSLLLTFCTICQIDRVSSFFFDLSCSTLSVKGFHIDTVLELK